MMVTGSAGGPSELLRGALEAVNAATSAEEPTALRGLARAATALARMLSR
jgi:hypothetical protein